MPDSTAADGPLQEETLASERLYEGRVIRVRRDRVRLPNGREAEREVVEHSAAVVILALDDAGRIPFVRQWRTPVGGPLLELPAGGVDPGEEPAAAAARELQEEVGLKPGTLERVHGFWVAPGWANEYLHGFIARGCTPSVLAADPDEHLVVERHRLGEALARVAAGEIQDAKSLVLLQALALRLIGPVGERIIGVYRGG